MSKNSGRSVFRRDGEWVNKRNDADRAGSVHRTQEELGTLRVKCCINKAWGFDGYGSARTIVSKDTKPPAHDRIRPEIASIIRLIRERTRI